MGVPDVARGRGWIVPNGLRVDSTTGKQ